MAKAKAPVETIAKKSNKSNQKTQTKAAKNIVPYADSARFAEWMREHVWLSVVAGGKGTRLWPISHSDRPKQFIISPGIPEILKDAWYKENVSSTLKGFGLPDDEDAEYTFIQRTVRRFVAGGINPKHVVVLVTNDRQEELVREQLIHMGVLDVNIMKVSEHYGYAGAMIKMTEFIYKLDKDAVIVNTPADHYTLPSENFYKTVNLAIENANKGFATIVGLVIRDSVMAQGLGHAIFDNKEAVIAKRVISFVEKPDGERAEELVRQDNSAGNTGINVWRADMLLRVIKKAKIDIEEIAKRELSDGLDTSELMKAFTDSNSLDVVRGDFWWRDAGTLSSLHEIMKELNDKTTHNNTRLGGGITIRENCENNLFFTESRVIVEALNLKDFEVSTKWISKDDTLVVSVVNHKSTQKTKKAAEEFSKVLETNSISIEAENNRVVPSYVGAKLVCSFVGVNNVEVSATKVSTSLLSRALGVEKITLHEEEVILIKVAQH